MYKDIISLEGMEFYAYHGCFAEEQKIGTSFLVDVHIEVDMCSAMASDRVEDTVNYQDVYDIVRCEMQKSSHLLEHVAGRIINALLEQKTQVMQVQVKLFKLNPPLGGQVKSSSVSITRVRKV